MSKHTPGPWVAEELYVMARNYRVATVHVGSSSNMESEEAGLAESHADARLIASAPDLLSALKYLLAQGEADGWSEMMLGDARAAIAKAEGK